MRYSLSGYLRDIFISIHTEDWSYCIDSVGLEGERIETITNSSLGVSIISSVKWYGRYSIRVKTTVAGNEILIRPLWNARSFAKKILIEVRDWHEAKKAKERLTSHCRIGFRLNGEREDYIF